MNSITTASPATAEDAQPSDPLVNRISEARVGTMSEHRFFQDPLYSIAFPAVHRAPREAPAGTSASRVRSSTISAPVTPVISRAGRLSEPVARRAGAREAPWTIDRIDSGTRLRDTTPVGRLLALFDVIHDLTNRPDHDARAFVEALSGTGGTADNRDVLRAQMRALVSSLVAEAGIPGAAALVSCWNILINGAIDQAAHGDLDAALLAQDMARTLLDQHRMPVLVAHPIATTLGESAGYVLDMDEYSHPSSSGVAPATGEPAIIAFDQAAAEFEELFGRTFP
jgi:hypothetical protein